jgi:5-carboxymethyl-2-hydroxymuconate isomerase
MPHFIIDCSANIISRVQEQKILATIFEATLSSGLFEEADIKVRLNPYIRYEVGGKSTDFIHVFSHILEGRTDTEISDLSNRIVKPLTELFPEVELIASSVEEFTKIGYCNRHLLTR